VTPSPDSGAWSRTVDVDGPTHYLDMGGPSDGPSVILVHGLGGSHLNWSAIGPSLSRHCRVKALDLVGHGLTPTGRRTPGIEGHRRLLGGFMEAVGAAPALLIGNSMGGLVAALQAATEPDTVAGLVLIDPALPTAHLGLVHPRVVANFLLCALPGVGEGYLSQRRRRTSAAQSVRRVLAICCVDPSRVRPDVVQAHVDLTERLDRARTDEAYLRSARSLSLLMANPATTMRTLDGVRQPTLLLHGQRDLLVPLSAARRMSSAHPGWRFEVAPDTGHVPMLETPRWTSEVIEDWLGREGSSAAARASTVGHALS
jgi:pimeloyl-ACP methyl ester carboxylesterase